MLEGGFRRRVRRLEGLQETLPVPLPQHRRGKNLPDPKRALVLLLRLGRSKLNYFVSNYFLHKNYICISCGILTCCNYYIKIEKAATAVIVAVAADDDDDDEGSADSDFPTETKLGSYVGVALGLGMIVSLILVVLCCGLVAHCRERSRTRTLLRVIKVSQENIYFFIFYLIGFFLIKTV